jgi:hypothetical protein
MSQFDPYQPPRYVPEAKIADTSRPAVITWYVVYCVAMALLYLALVGFGVFMLAVGTGKIEGFEGEETKSELLIQGILFTVMGLPFSAFYLGGALVPRKKWGWIYGIVAIAIGLTSCCLLPATVPLLIFWLKPQTKDFFNAT